MNGNDFRDFRVIVTGGGSGMGRRCAELLAEAGAKVALLDFNKAAAHEVAGAVSGRAWQCDVSDAAAVPGVMAEAIDWLGGLDGLINAAGITSTERIGSTGIDHWTRVIAVNMTGTFLTCQAAAPALAQSDRAAIVNIGSAAALLPTTSGATYAAAKGGVIAFSKALANELAPKVRVNVVCPGATDTPMLSDALAQIGMSAAKLDASVYALKRIGKPDELARAILFLLGPDASFITGTALAVDGGRSFH